MTEEQGGKLAARPVARARKSGAKAAAAPQAAPGVASLEVHPQALDEDRSAAGRVEATHVTITQGGAAEVEAESVTVTQGGIGAASADDISVTVGGIGRAQADEIAVKMAPSASRRQTACPWRWAAWDSPWAER